MAEAPVPDLTGPLAQARQADLLPEAPKPQKRLSRLRGQILRSPSGQRFLASRAGQLERVRERIQQEEEQRLLAQARAGRDVCWTHEEETDPLVTVRVGTYNRGQLFIERGMESILGQTYPNLEVLVVGDACDEATSKAVQSVDDDRVRFVNLPTRGLYPDDPYARWLVTGNHPVNAALLLARGTWLAPCDDDDWFTPTHVERLLDHAIRHRLEMVWSRAGLRQADGSWVVTPGPPLSPGHISHGAVMYSLGLRFFRYSDTCWKLPEANDWNLWRRMQRAGVRIGFLDELTYLHY